MVKTKKPCFTEAKQSKPNVLNISSGRALFLEYCARITYIIRKYGTKLAQRASLQDKKLSIIQQCRKSSQDETSTWAISSTTYYFVIIPLFVASNIRFILFRRSWLIATEDLNELKLCHGEFISILLSEKKLANNLIIVFQKNSRKILYRFSTRLTGYRKKRTNQYRILFAGKGEVFQKDDLLHRIGNSKYLRYSLSGNPGGQYDPRLFTSKRRTNLYTGGES